jgi:hypothetical protein
VGVVIDVETADFCVDGKCSERLVRNDGVGHAGPYERWECTGCGWPFLPCHCPGAALVPLCRCGSDGCNDCGCRRARAIFDGRLAPRELDLSKESPGVLAALERIRREGWRP